MLSRAVFTAALKKIQAQEAAVEEFSKALSKLSDGYTTFDIDNQYLQALRDVLAESMHDRGDWIGWWLFEASDYTVSWDEDGKEVSVNLEDMNDLYNFMLNNTATLTDEELPITDTETHVRRASAHTQKDIDFCDFSNCLERISSYVSGNDVILHITKEGLPHYVLMNTQYWNRLTASSPEDEA